MTRTMADVVICGAGMAGVAAGYHLAVRQGIENVVLVDERPPLTLTSNKGTEAYRNWWPGPDGTMVRFMNRSIDLLERLALESGNAFRLNRRGYVFLTANPTHVPVLIQMADEVSALGAGPLRHHPGATPYIPSSPHGFEDIPDGADLVLDRELIRRQFPFIADDVVAMLHVRRAGWLNSQRLGHELLAQAQSCGLRLQTDRVEAVTVRSGRVEAVRLRSGDEFSTRAFVIAAGPYLSQVAAMLGLSLPVINELHGKMAFRDYLGIVPREAPLMIWDDALRLPWTVDERQTLAARRETCRLLDEFPSGVHFRTREEAGGSSLLVIWTYDRRVQEQEPVWPPAFDPHYPEVLLRGVSRMVPGLSAYWGQGSKAFVDGGYYCKTRENLPLVGPLPVKGAYVIGALSGYGIMGSQAAGELLAAHVVGAALPDYAPAFLLERYQDPAYRAMVERWEGSGGQL